VLEHILCLHIKLFHPFVRSRTKTKPDELQTKLSANGFRKRTNQYADDPKFPNAIVCMQNMPDVGHKRRTNRRKKGSEDMGDGPIIILKAPDELTKDGFNLGVSGLDCRPCTFNVHFACRDKIARVIHRIPSIIGATIIGNTYVCFLGSPARL
jgi:hypothetical protein